MGTLLQGLSGKLGNQVILNPLNTKKFEEFSALLSGSEFGGCFCAVWRSLDDTWSARCSSEAKPNLEITRKNVDGGLHTGFLVYEDSDLIGWTGSGPKTEFPILETKLGSRLTEFSSDIWSMGCIAVKESSRGKSKSNKIIQAVINLAKLDGAKYVESYPTDPWDEARSYRGSLSQFTKLGFERFGDENDKNSKITCMRLKL
ncbi:MAG: hypothetical protein HOE90_13550 [Bacteriovoracaceae bacterium]|nr:hypothetical protein [Bacteriovoracaceae bacterium]